MTTRQDGVTITLNICNSYTKANVDDFSQDVIHLKIDTIIKIM